jgi:hypothetical protein
VSDRILTASDVEAIVEAIARKVVEIVDARSSTFGLVDARELAEELGVSIDYVYAHATELGAMRLGSGPKARIRFRSRPGATGPGAEAPSAGGETPRSPALAALEVTTPLLRCSNGQTDWLPAWPIGSGRSDALVSWRMRLRELSLRAHARGLDGVHAAGGGDAASERLAVLRGRMMDIR